MIFCFLSKHCSKLNVRVWSSGFFMLGACRHIFVETPLLARSSSPCEWATLAQILSCILGWPRTPCVAQNGLEVMNPKSGITDINQHTWSKDGQVWHRWDAFWCRDIVPGLPSFTPHGHPWITYYYSRTLYCGNSHFPIHCWESHWTGIFFSSLSFGSECGVRLCVLVSLNNMAKHFGVVWGYRSSKEQWKN